MNLKNVMNLKANVGAPTVSHLLTKYFLIIVFLKTFKNNLTLD